MVPRMAQIATMTANEIIPFEKSFEGSFILLTYGETFSHPPTANTKMDNPVKNFTSKVGINVSNDQSISSNGASVIIGAATIKRMYKIDITNIAEPANVESFLMIEIPLEAKKSATKKITIQIDCITSGSNSLARLSWNNTQLVATTAALGFC